MPDRQSKCSRETGIRGQGWGRGGGIIHPRTPKKVLPPPTKFLFTVLLFPEKKKKICGFFYKIGNFVCRRKRPKETFPPSSPPFQVKPSPPPPKAKKTLPPQEKFPRSPPDGRPLAHVWKRTKSNHCFSLHASTSSMLLKVTLRKRLLLCEVQHGADKPEIIRYETGKVIQSKGRSLFCAKVQLLCKKGGGVLVEQKAIYLG